MGMVARAGDSRSRGFTLAELMVVIAIIIVLVSMLMPFLGGAHERAYQSLCQNNLHKIGQAMGTAASNAGGAIPTGDAWLLAARTYGSTDILRCPKGSYRGTGSDVRLTGQIEVIDPPDSIVFNSKEDNKIIWAFQERAGYSLPQSVTVDIGSPGRYNNNYGSSSKTIPAGTMVDCYFLHFDPKGSQNTTTDGQIMEFTDEVRGIIVTTGKLNDTDTVLGVADTVYDTGRGARGFENNAEQVEWSLDGKKFIVHRFHSTFPGEEVRILTKPGGEASYGINALVNNRDARKDQIWVVEYQRVKVNVLLDKGWDAYSAPRHYDKSNALMVGGHVKLLTPEEYDGTTGDWFAERKR